MNTASDRDAPFRYFLVRRWQNKRWSTESDFLVVEEPLEIRVNNQTLAAIMRTPGHEFELVHGFLLAEGFFYQSDYAAVEIEWVRDELGLRIPNVVNCAIPNFSSHDFEKGRRRLTATSSCGICGRASLEQVFLQAPPLSGDFKISFIDLQSLPDHLYVQQAAFSQTGGLHAAALFSQEGKLFAVREDIGRHNAVDKVVGWALQQRMYPLSNCGLLVSGRLSFEMAQKALLAGIPMVAAISAASSLAVELAEESGMTLVGFLREGQAVIYAGQQRIDDSCNV
ncbi:MAG: formate dehydrogenase accessory sulfurtransferase FdhD [bacterium]